MRFLLERDADQAPRGDSIMIEIISMPFRDIEKRVAAYERTVNPVREKPPQAAAATLLAGQFSNRVKKYAPARWTNRFVLVLCRNGKQGAMV